ncbi:MAG: UDP-2,3-diacylglucosamine diphosphatase LpxI [Pirellulales bacterium]|nr:UDP-2,3-diacylglucosamine diphosphatase LpxI [Pirellulales bacterium]
MLRYTTITPPATAPSRPKIGLIAGWGEFPRAVAQALARQNYDIYCLGIAQHADPALQNLAHEFQWIGLGQLGRAIRFFARRGVPDALMAGKVFKTRLYERGAWWRHFPDWRALRVFWPHFVTTQRDRRDDTLLLAIVEAFAADGITLGPATNYAPELLVPAGQLTKKAPTDAQWADIRFGWKLAKELGRLDIGQSVVVKDRTAVAVEALEGTDACIRRAGELCTAGGFTVVKTAKPQQDMRFDVPTVGVLTLESMLAAGGKVLAIEADKTILVEQEQFIKFADQQGLVVVALREGEFAGS